MKLNMVKSFSPRSCGVWGGVVDGGISIYKNVRAVRKGRKSAGEATWGVAKDAAGGVLSGVGSAVVGTAAGTATTTCVAGSALAGTALGAAACFALPLTAVVVAGFGINSLYHAMVD